MLRWLASLTYEPEKHSDPNEISPFHPEYYDEFTPEAKVEEIKLKQAIREEKRRQKYIDEHTNRLTNRKMKGKQNHANHPNPEIFESEDTDLDPTPVFPDPPLVAVEEEKVHQAVRMLILIMNEQQWVVAVSRRVIARWF